jgi:hypothetical protein
VWWGNQPGPTWETAPAGTEGNLHPIGNPDATFLVPEGENPQAQRGNYALNVDPGYSGDFAAFAEKLLATAKATGEVVQAKFNGTPVIMPPHGTMTQSAILYGMALAHQEVANGTAPQQGSQWEHLQQKAVWGNEYLPNFGTPVWKLAPLGTPGDFHPVGDMDAVYEVPEGVNSHQFRDGFALNVDPGSGEFDQWAQRMIQMAFATGGMVQAKFNGVTVVARATDESVARLAVQYGQESVRSESVKA